MKRKRGNKKGKKKGPTLAPKNEAAANLVTLIKDDNSDDDANGDDNNVEEYERGVEVDTPSSTGTDQPMNLASINPDGSIDKTIQGKSLGRVKVKLKTSKVLESQSDTDKSSLQLGMEKQCVVSDKVEDTGNSVSEVETGVSGNVSKKPGSIKIKSSKVMGGLSVEKSSSAVKAQVESLQQKEPRTPCQESQYNKQELDSALEVIKKVMKMDAAEPFNVPVNPEALGIPDYFDVIDTPMDFGTICRNIEMGGKYMNSEDVYMDVQYIWDNCYKYNNKGDYILDLMRRVKKNFMKYWTAAGLYTEQSRGSSGAEGAQGDEVGVTSQGHGKSGPKQKSKKRHGRRHKSDCLCAICVLKRRRREREENERLANQKLVQELKQEGSSLMESPAGEDSSSNMDESLDQDADAEVEGKGVEVKMEDTEQQYSADKEKHEEVEDDDDDDEDEDEDEEEKNEIEIQKKGKVETSQQSEFTDRSGDDPNQQPQPGLAENAGAAVQTNFQKVHVTGQHEDETVAFQRNKNKESQERQQKAKMFEKFRPENPMLLSLCQTLFPDNHRSVWSGPHSLVPRQGSAHKNSIDAAIETLMK